MSPPPARRPTGPTRRLAIAPAPPARPAPARVRAALPAALLLAGLMLAQAEAADEAPGRPEADRTPAAAAPASGPAATASPGAEPAEAAGSAAARGWTPIGRMGLVMYVIVPVEHARDAGFHQRVIDEACGPAPRCFLRLFTNSQGVAPELPLPEAIANEPTAMFQRSDKRGSQEFRWSCRLQIDSVSCF